MKWLERVAVLAVLVMIVALARTTYADPAGASGVAQEASSTFNASAYSPQSANAQAGNVSQLSINATRETNAWQGFYGNISGEIVLADASGNNFYNWTLSDAQPQGEVYASRASDVDWTTINCTNATEITAEETFLGKTATDGDSVTNTYTSISHPGFSVGSTSISNCNSTNAYDSTGGGSNFWQVLLIDGDTDANSDVVYTTILDATTQSGFNSLDWNFELLVGENGTNPSVTAYYFYTELS
jgi:hypothetical protein